jgi:hypothetical protein
MIVIDDADGAVLTRRSVLVTKLVLEMAIGADDDNAEVSRLLRDASSIAVVAVIRLAALHVKSREVLEWAARELLSTSDELIEELKADARPD